MDQAILNILRCPVSGAPLELLSIESEKHDGRVLIRTGVLYCPESRLWFPIINYVPVMLTFRTQLADAFERQYAGVFARLEGYRKPELPPMQGEIDVQRSFTDQWAGLGDDPLTFIYTDSELLALHRDVWLHLPPGGDPHVRSVLNVGCGFGREAEILARIFPNAAVFGIDLNLSLLKAADRLKDHPRLHLIIASLFRLPFARESFDHVHSQGVIHHTYSTQEAFRSIAAFVGTPGSLFVWVYAKEDGLMVPGLWGMLTRGYLFITNNIGRPVLSRLPNVVRNVATIAIAAVMHLVYKWRSHHPAQWRLQNTLHSVRDIFTPRHAHLHGFNEVLSWFEEAGFAPQMQSPMRYRALIGKPLRGIGVLGRRSGPDQPADRPGPGAAAMRGGRGRSAS